MRQVLVSGVFMLAILGWAVAQQPAASQQPSAGQATSPSSPAPGASQSQSSAPGAASQGSAQTGTAPGTQSQAANKPITEGCLGGSDPNFTVTDKAGTTYKLALPPNAVTSSLTPHIGEPVLVMGDVMSAGSPGNASSINVIKIGRGTGSCPGSNSKPPKP